MREYWHLSPCGLLSVFHWESRNEGQEACFIAVWSLCFSSTSETQIGAVSQTKRYLKITKPHLWVLGGLSS
jgi:hypothetical protein